MLLAAVAQSVEVAVAAVIQVAVDGIAYIIEEDECAAMEHWLHDAKVFPPVLVFHARI